MSEDVLIYILIVVIYVVIYILSQIFMFKTVMQQ